jgi:hypothetical protein
VTGGSLRIHAEDGHAGKSGPGVANLTKLLRADRRVVARIPNEQDLRARAGRSRRDRFALRGFEREVGGRGAFRLRGGEESQEIIEINVQSP